MEPEYVVVGLLALAGFLAGGVYVTWKTAKVMAILLLCGVILAAGGAAFWYFEL